MSTLEYIKMLPAGILSIIAAFFIYFSLSCLIQFKDKWRYKILLQFGCWLISTIIIFIGDWVNMTYTLLFFLAVVWVSCIGSNLKKFTLGMMFSCTTFAFNALYDNCIAFLAHIYDMDSFYGNMYLVGRLFFAVFLYLSLRFRKADRSFELSAPLWRLMLSLSLAPLGIMLSLILLRNSDYSLRLLNQTLIADTALFLVVMLSFAGLLRALTVLEKQQQLELENALIRQNKSYYEAMETQQFEIRRLRHDMTNHLQTLLILPPQQRDDYIQEMLDTPALVQIFSWCADPTVNAVLTAKESLMRQNKIPFSAKAAIAKPLPFEKSDICAIFANALDNAAESCLKLEESLRRVQLEAKAGKGILAINISNSCQCASAPSQSSGDNSAVRHLSLHAKKPTETSQLPRTTKKDAKNHGLGLRSIQSIVKKYGGSMEIRQEEEMFHLFLYLPMDT
ncbi:MAG: GHKL domain-containing protein [Lachnospiraceae bacterium]|nr:GHKL domain-containing protein [Lachnospiraceae bacterium]